MKLLIVTQAVDENDPVLGFFCGWIRALAPRFERVTVIALSKGRYDLPENVSVFSLGKERKARTQSAYALSFLSLAWRARRDYDAVFVHMNQEYILIAGWLWKLLSKRVYLWRNHQAGSFFTDVAAFFCDKIFCTSKHSYTARFEKTMRMPVGVDTVRFNAQGASREAHSILFLSRMAPSKRPEVLLDALALLEKGRASFHAQFIGSPLPKDEQWYTALRKRAMDVSQSISFGRGVSNSEAAELFKKSECFVNCSPSGMFDKTLFEAAASGCIVLAASADWKELAGNELSFETPQELAEKLAAMLTNPESGDALKKRLHEIAEEHSLARLSEKLVSAIV
jgi:glycosyltransferase involved in cell wall biosynthesis